MREESDVRVTTLQRNPQHNALQFLLSVRSAGKQRRERQVHHEKASLLENKVEKDNDIIKKKALLLERTG